MKNSIDISRKIREQIKNLAGFTIYQRGLDYFKSQTVQKMKIEALENSSNKIVVSGEVEGHDIYVGEFYFDLQENKILATECDCPYNNFCKHTVALSLTFLEIYKKFLEEHQEINFVDISFQRNYFLRWFKKNKTSQFNFTTEEKEIYQPEKDNNKKTEKDSFQKRFSVLIKSNFRFEVILKEKFGGNFDSNYSLKRLLIKEKEYLKQPQIDLINFLIDNDFWEETIKNLSEFIKLLEESELDLYLEFDYEQNPIKIISSGQKKIKIKFRAEKEKIISSLRTEPVEITTIFSEIKANLFGDQKKVIFGKNSLLIITPKKIVFHKMSAIILKLLQDFRDNFDYLSKEKILNLKLSNDFIFNFNQLLRDSQKYLDLETNLPLEFEIKKFSEFKKNIIIDYDNDTAVMKISPAINYGFIDVILPEIFSKIRQKGKEYLQEKSFGNVGRKYIVNINIDKKIIYYAIRKINLEREFYQQIIKKYLEFDLTKTGRSKKTGNENIFAYYNNIFPKFKKNGYQIKFLKDKLEFESEEFRANFQIDFNAKNDWLAFDVDAYCGNDKITLEDLQNFVNQKDGFLKTKKGKLINIKNFTELEKFVNMLESFNLQKGTTNSFKGKIYHAPELENIFTNSKYYQTQLDQAFSNFMQETKSGQPVKKIKLTTEKDNILRDYQKNGINWFYFLRKYHFAGILADDMGLGKTLQALTLLEMNQKENKPSIVICPKTLLYNWKNETEKFTPNLKTIIIDGSPVERKKMIKDLSQKSNKMDLIITSYPMMQRDFKTYQAENIKFNYCILDEAQMIKNYQTKNAKVVKQIDADYRLVLTGTPLENSVVEIWSMFDFLMPGFLGSFQVFSKKFLNPIMKQNNLNVLQNLQKKIAPFMLRRTKEEVLQELPAKIENIQRSKLTDSQNILYQEILAQVKKNIFKTVATEGFEKSQIHIFAALMKLRQVCNHPALLLKNEHYTKYESAKLDTFNLLIDEIISENRKVLVFSQFTTMLEILEQEIKKKKIKYSYLTGQTRNRQVEIDNFNKDKDIKVFLISLKAGGLGLNLTAADTVIIFDPWWNPSVENQAIDRTHRIGQKKSVNVYRLITTGTIEEKILKLQQRKKYLFTNLVGESRDLFQKITWEDIQSLFR